MKTYKFEITIDEESGKFLVRHNCSNMVEFLGVIELIKTSVVGGIAQSKQNKPEEQKENRKQGIDPHEELARIMRETKEYKSKGIVKAFGFGYNTN